MTATLPGCTARSNACITFIFLCVEASH